MENNFSSYDLSVTKEEHSKKRILKDKKAFLKVLLILFLTVTFMAITFIIINIDFFKHNMHANASQNTYSVADNILADIINAEMSQRETAKAIHTWIKSNIRYINTGENLDVMQSALNGIKKKKGDCFVYYAVSEMLLTRAGLENQGVERIDGITDHFWNIVKVDGQWYHFDACPTPSPFDTFLFTESEAERYTEEAAAYNRTNYYVYDKEKYPLVALN